MPLGDIEAYRRIVDTFEDDGSGMYNPIVTACTHMLDELERLADRAMFNGLLKNAYLNRLAAVFVLSMEANAVDALKAIEEDIREGFLGMADIPTSASLFERADDLERRAMQCGPRVRRRNQPQPPKET